MISSITAVDVRNRIEVIETIILLIFYWQKVLNCGATYAIFQSSCHTLINYQFKL